MPTLRFTGKRTGLDGIWLPKHGPVFRGGEIEVSHETAASYLRQPSDFELVEEESGEDFWAIPEPEPTPEPVAEQFEPAPPKKRGRPKKGATA